MHGIMRFNTVNGKHCCNLNNRGIYRATIVSFNTVNSKGCCNIQWNFILFISLFD